MPKVSIILPTFNREQTLPDAVESILCQTYTDFEVIIVDDGSTDHSAELLIQYRQRDNRIKYFYQENKGRSAARNQGIKQALGEYITFLDSDDVYMPTKIQREVEFLDNNTEIDFVYCLYSLMEHDGQPRLKGWAPSYDFRGRIYPDMLFFKGTIITAPSVMIRSKLLDISGLFDERMDICEDLDLWRRISRHYFIEQIKERLVKVRMKRHDNLPLWDFLKAREFFYEKAVKEDASLKNIRIELYTEVYSKYALRGLRQRDLTFFFFAMRKLFLLGPGIFLPLMKFLKEKFVSM